MKNYFQRKYLFSVNVIVCGLFLMSNTTASIQDEDVVINSDSQSNTQRDSEAGAEAQQTLEQITQDIAIEEIIVRATKTSASIRAELKLAEKQFYSGYNDLNLIEEFDIDCRSVQGTNSRIPRDVCWPVFFDESLASSAQEFLLGISVFEPAQTVAFKNRSSWEALRENVAKTANENPSLKESLIELLSLDAALDMKIKECEERPAFLGIFRLCR